MQKTQLEWDNYIGYLIDAINISKYMKRAENKPMSTPKMPNESHISTRSMHLKESADIIKRLSKALGLNEDYAYTGMLMHDAGHPFSAHEGEEIFIQLGELYDTQYYHHNAKGIEIILSENLCGKAIDKIPGIENNPELRKRLEEEFYYFLDIIISHDGEATQKEVEKAKKTKYSSIKEAVLDKSKRANAHHDYKFVAETPEGKLAKYADVIAYLSSDMQDAFRLKIMQGINNNYYYLIGRVFAIKYSREDPEKYPEGSFKEKEDYIKLGKKVYNKIINKHLSESGTRGVDEHPDFKAGFMGVLKYVTDSGLRLYVNKEDEADIRKYYNDQAEKIGTKEAYMEAEQEAEQAIENLHAEVKHNWEIVSQKVDEAKATYIEKRVMGFFQERGIEMDFEQAEELRKRIMEKYNNNLPVSELESDYTYHLNTIYSDVDRMEEMVAKLLKVNSDSIYEITSQMKEFFISDIIATTREKMANGTDNNIPQMSQEVSDLFFGDAKVFNYKGFVRFTNFVYQTEEYPKAVKNLADECAESLIKSGIIASKFYDPEIRRLIRDPEALRYINIKGVRNYGASVDYRRKHSTGRISGRVKPIKVTYTDEDKDVERQKFHADVYNYIQNEDLVFAIRYENTFHAIKDRISQKIDLALKDPELKKPIDHKTKKERKLLFKNELLKQLAEINEEIKERYGTTKLTPEQLEEYKQLKIAEGLKDIERKMARQLCSDYLAGMTDRAFTRLGERIGVIPPDLVENSERGAGDSTRINNLADQHSQEERLDEKGDERI